ncbi:MAG: hypothetical protein IID49_00665 [Proteobacteria bacterium]|nr:hypothetical protein [Pseudomonadota bacterium]MCH8950627.1 hypothetical protein [Pseudomonadota bacterium]
MWETSIAKNAFQALVDLGLLGAARLISISATANEHAPGGGERANSFAHTGRAAAKSTFGPSVAADAPLGTPVEPEMCHQ